MVLQRKRERKIRKILNDSKTMICKLLNNNDLERQNKRSGRKKKLSDRNSRRIVELAR